MLPSNIGKIPEMELFVILSVCLSLLTNVDAVEAAETATDLEDFMKTNIEQSTEYLFNSRSGSILFSTLSPSVLPNLLSTTSLPNSIAPKEYFEKTNITFNSSGLSADISSLSQISISSVTNLASDTLSVPSSTTVGLSNIFQGSSILPTPTGIPPLAIDLTGLDGKNLVTTEMPTYYFLNTKATPNLPFVTTVTQSKDLHHQTRSLILRTSSDKTSSLVNSEENSNTLPPEVSIGSSVFYLSPSSSLIDEYLTDPYSTSTPFNQIETLPIDSLTISGLLNSRLTSTATVTINISLNSTKDSPTNEVDSNTKDSIYPFTFTFTSNSTSSLIFVMPAIVCVVLASMLFTVIKRWHFYCKLKKYRLRTSNTTESALSSTITPSQRPSTSNANDISNIGQNQAMASPANANVPTHKRAASTTSPKTYKTDNIYKPALEYINRGFKYSPNCPIHGKRLTRISSTQAVIEV